MFKSKTVVELIQIASAGGGFKLDAKNKNVLELIQIANAAANGGGRIIFTGLGNKTTIELIQISNAGKGNIFFED